MSYDSTQAAAYDDDPEHVLPDAELAVWLDCMAGYTGPDRPGQTVLDIGAGTGLLTAALKHAGYAVKGLEPSRAMIAAALERQAELGEADLVQGHADEADLFALASFDWIVTRQTACHFHDPLNVFKTWHRWLRPGGLVLIVDGCWSAENWPGPASARPPYACLTTPDPVANDLTAAGFTVLQSRIFEPLNTARRHAGACTTLRYIVVGARTG